MRIEFNEPKVFLPRRPVNGPSASGTNPPNRPSIAANKPVINKSNVKSRLYEPKCNILNRRPVATSNPQQQQSQRKGLKKPTNQKVDFELEENEETIKPTIATRIANIEETYKNAIEHADSELAAIVAELTFTTNKLDEAAEYCDRTDAYVDLHKFYDEMLDLSRKMAEKRTVLQSKKAECLETMHDYMRFLTKNLLPFHELMDIRQKAINEIITKAKEAEEVERERMRFNPSFYKKVVETKEISVQVCPESLIYYSPTAGVLRSSVKQKIVLPASPVLRTELTPRSSLLGRQNFQFQPRSNLHMSYNSSMYGGVGGNDTVVPSISYDDCSAAMLASASRSHSNGEKNRLIRNNYQSPFAKRLNFDEFGITAEFDNSTSAKKLGRISEVAESPITAAINANDAVLRSVNSKFETTRFKYSMPQAPVLLSDKENKF